MDAYPHLNINVKDESAFTPIPSELLPLHRPIYTMKTEKGPVHVPVWCPDYTTAKSIFGEKTFDNENLEYFSRESVFLVNSFPSNGAFIVRLGDIGDTGTMAKASYVLECTVPDSADTDNDDYVFGYRELGSEETIAGLQASDDTSDNTTTYPIMAFEAKDEGKYGNDYGFRLWVDNTDKSELYDRMSTNSTFYLNFGFVKKDYGFDTFSNIKTKFSPFSFTFATTDDLKEEGLAVDFANTLYRYFDDSYPAPINTHFYTDNFKAVQQNMYDKYHDTSGITDYDTSDTEDITGFTADRINIFTGEVLINNDGAYNWESIADDTSIPNIDISAISAFNNATPKYLTGGSDGVTDTSGASIDNDDDIELLRQKFFDLTNNPQIVDKAKYPFNTIIDTGYINDTKDDIVDFLSIRDDVKVVMTPWQGTTIYDEADTIGQSSALATKIILHKESELFGTKTFRATIFGQVGILNGELYKKTVPLTIWYATKLAEFHNLQYIKDQPAGLPNSEVDMFKSINWVPYDKVTKRALWDECINYCQYYDMTHLHFPGLKSIYDNDTSVLSTDSFTNTVVYIKQLVLPVWAKYAGLDDANTNAIYAQVINELETKLSSMLAGRYGFNVSMYQTEEERNLGYAHHVNIELTGGPAQRVWNLDIICKRTGFEG